MNSGILFDALSAAQNGKSLALEGAGSREAEAGWRNGEVGVGKGRDMGVPKIEQDGGRFALGVTSSSVD